MKKESHNFRPAVLAAALVFLACMAAYLPTLNPVFRADDSPETITAAVHLGIQHPPGYPLHTLVGHLFTRLPLASPAFRLNLMAAFFAALASALLCLLVYQLIARHRRLRLDGLNPMTIGVIAAASGLMLGFSKTFWSQALAAKGGIYTFHAALIMIMACLLLDWEQRADQRAPALPGPAKPWRQAPLSALARLVPWALHRMRLFHHRGFYAFCLIAGLAAGNHWETQKVVLLTSALFSLGLFAQAKPDSSLPARRIFWEYPAKGLGLLLAAGVVIYLFLPLRASVDPPMNWGEPNSWERFWWVFERQQYLDLETGFLKSLKAWAFSSGPWSTVASNFAFVQRQAIRVADHLALHAHMGYPALLFSIAGFAYLIRRRAWAQLGWWGGMGLALASAITFYFHLKPEMIWILDVFLIPAFAAQAVMAGLGLAWLLHSVAQKLPVKAIPAAAALLALLCVFPLKSHARVLSQRTQFWAYDFARDFMDFLPRKAVVLAEGDFNTMPVYYLQHVEGRRLDVTHLTTIFMAVDWGIEQVKRRHPELGVSAVARPMENKRQGDGALLLQAVRQILKTCQAQDRPLLASLFREVLKANAGFLESGFTPYGLTALYTPGNSASDPAMEAKRLGLLKAMRSRFWQVDRDQLEDSPAFALSNYAAAWMDLGARRRAQGREAEALELFKTAAKLATRPNLAQSYVHLGIGYNALGQAKLQRGDKAGAHKDFEKAAEWFKKSAEEKPLFESYSNLAGTYNQLQRYADAEAAARKAISLNANAPQNWNNLGIALYYQNRGLESVEALRRALSLDPSNAQTLQNLRAIEAALGQGGS